MIHNFLSTEEADAMLQELLQEAPTFKRDKFQMFDRAVESPHTTRLYVDSWDEAEDQKTQYMYNGGLVSDIGKTPPEMLKISTRVREAVNNEIKRRIRDFQPNGEKLKFQSPDEWTPNASFVNCYSGMHFFADFENPEVEMCADRTFCSRQAVTSPLVGIRII